MNSGLTHDTGMTQLRVSQIVRAVGQPLVLTPLSSIAYAGIEKSQVGSASGLYNMLRNLGGSIGTSGLGTLSTRREQFHSERIGESVSIYSLQTQQRIEQMTQFFISHGADAYTAQHQAIAFISNTVRREAYVMAYSDCFYSMGCALLLSMFAVLCFKKVKAAGGAAH